ncbi:hypothetical protein DFH29DRAFT_910727 [Suillus ampliporus]|nr:hypothetical protein DFH29DRAFT_910727 [Suillus ampliporus]
MTPFMPQRYVYSPLPVMSTPIQSWPSQQSAFDLQTIAHAPIVGTTVALTVARVILTGGPRVRLTVGPRVRLTFTALIAPELTVALTAIISIHEAAKMARMKERGILCAIMM